MLSGETLRLRAFVDEDLALLTRLRNDPEIAQQLLSRPRGSSPAQVRDWVRARTSTAEGLFFVLAELAEDQAIGYLQYTLSLVDRTAELGICLAPEVQGHGHGGDALATGEAYLGALFAIRKIWLRVRADNHQAIGCYRKAGYEACGLQRAHMFLEGDWRDVLTMEKFLPGAVP